MYIDDLHPSCTTQKFMENVTITEVITKGSDSADSTIWLTTLVTQSSGRKKHYNEVEFQEDENNDSWQHSEIHMR